ncbi:VOC family protein [Sorangium sp. So ce363]|uniref:VOC family protein n=1 Tax=Sorangium sp. So ce363 TaxID=3133304 RepID=UPI003F5F77BA
MNVLKPHISLNVSNIDASVAFYERAFGVRATKRRPGYDAACCAPGCCVPSKLNDAAAL